MQLPPITAQASIDPTEQRRRQLILEADLLQEGSTHDQTRALGIVREFGIKSLNDISTAAAEIRRAALDEIHKAKRDPRIIVKASASNSEVRSKQLHYVNLSKFTNETLTQEYEKLSGQPSLEKLSKKIKGQSWDSGLEIHQGFHGNQRLGVSKAAFRTVELNNTVYILELRLYKTVTASTTQANVDMAPHFNNCNITLKLVDLVNNEIALDAIIRPSFDLDKVDTETTKYSFNPRNLARKLLDLTKETTPVDIFRYPTNTYGHNASLAKLAVSKEFETVIKDLDLKKDMRTLLESKDLDQLLQGGQQSSKDSCPHDDMAFTFIKRKGVRNEGYRRYEPPNRGSSVSTGRKARPAKQY